MCVRIFWPILYFSNIWVCALGQFIAGHRWSVGQATSVPLYGRSATTMGGLLVVPPAFYWQALCIGFHLAGAMCKVYLT